MNYSRIPTRDSIRRDLEHFAQKGTTVPDDLVDDLLSAVVAHRRARTAKQEAHIQDILSRPFTTYKLPAQVAHHNRAMLERALRLAAKGFLVIPAHRFDPVAGCTAAARRHHRLTSKGEIPDGAWFESQAKRSKFPVGVRWQERASRDFETIWQLFNTYPAAIYDKQGDKTGKEETRQLDFTVNLSIVTGRRAGYFAVDLDGEEGVAAWKAFEAKHGPFPETVMSCSGSGTGWHIFYRLPPGVELHNTASRFGSGGTVATKVDIRSFHGQVIGADSLHKSGGYYAWVDDCSPFDIAMAPAPDAVVSEAIACSKVAQREQEERNGTAPPGKTQRRTTKDDLDDGADVESEYVPHDGLPGGTVNRIAQIGYGKGTAECINAAVFSAVLSFFWERGYGVDTAGLEADIVARIYVATKDHPGKRGRYTERSYVSGVVKDAKDKAKLWGYAESKPYQLTLDEALAAASKLIPDGIGEIAALVEHLAVSRFSPSEMDKILTKMAGNTQRKASALLADIKDAKRRNTQRRVAEDKTDSVSVMNERCAVFEGRTKVEFLMMSKVPGRLPGQYDKANFLLTDVGGEVIGVDEKGNDILAGAEWIKDKEHHRTVYAIDFAPPAAEPLPDDTLNLWNGWPVLKDMSHLTDSQLRSECSLYLDHVLTIMANGHAAGCDYILDVVADTFQAPGTKPGASLVFIGGFGSGKTTFWRCIRKAYGDYLLKMNTAQQFNAVFNEHKVCKIWHVSEEATYAGDKAGANQQKDETTADEQLVNPKFRAQFVVHDYARKMILANDLIEAATMQEGDRRSSVFRTSDKLEKMAIEDRAAYDAYFAALYGQMNGDGCAAFVELMRRRKYDQVHLRRPYDTEAKQAMVRGQVNPAVRWLLDSVKLEEFSSTAREGTDAVPPVKLAGDGAAVVTHGGRPMVALPQKVMRRHFLEELQRAPERYAKARYGTLEALGDLLADLLGCSTRVAPGRVNGGMPEPCWFAPLIDDIRAALLTRKLLRPEDVLGDGSIDTTSAGRWSEFGREARVATDAAVAELGETVDREVWSRMREVIAAERRRMAEYEEHRDHCDAWDRAVGSVEP